MGWFDSLFSSGGDSSGGGMDWGSIIAGGAMSLLGGRDQRKQSKEDWKRKLEELRMNFISEREGAAQGRQWELEDRKFKGDAMGNYAQFYTGPEVQRPGPIDTTVTLRDIPPELGGKAPAGSEPPKKKKRKKKGGILGKLFG